MVIYSTCTLNRFRVQSSKAKALNSSDYEGLIWQFIGLKHEAPFVAETYSTARVKREQVNFTQRLINRVLM